MIEYILKRDGRKVKFDLQKITDAIFKAAQAVGGNDYQEAQRLALAVLSVLLNLIFLFGVPLKINYRWIKDAIVRYLPDTLLLLIRHIYNLAVKSF